MLEKNFNTVFHLKDGPYHTLKSKEWQIPPETPCNVSITIRHL